MIHVVVEHRAGGLHVVAEQQAADVIEIEDQLLQRIALLQLGQPGAGRQGIRLRLQPHLTAGGLLALRLLGQPGLAAALDLLLEGIGPLGDVVLHQQVLGQGQQQAIAGGGEAGPQHRLQALLLTPEAAQDQEALGRLGPHPRQHRRIAGAHLQQQLLGGGPELALLLVGIVLQHPGRLVGAVAGDHHRLAGIEQEGGGDVLAGQGREGHRIGRQLLEQVLGQGRGGIEIAVLAVDDQRQLARHQIAHLQQQLQPHRPEGLIEAEAGLVGTHMRGGGLDHRLDPVARLAEEGAAGQAAPRRPALQHLGVGIQPGHQQRLARGDRIGELDEETHARLRPALVAKRAAGAGASG
jgi:hypothetical protein